MAAKYSRQRKCEDRQSPAISCASQIRLAGSSAAQRDPTDAQAAGERAMIKGAVMINNNNKPPSPQAVLASSSFATSDGGETTLTDIEETNTLLETA
jgi:hypothetical protein